MSSISRTTTFSGRLIQDPPIARRDTLTPVRRPRTAIGILAVFACFSSVLSEFRSCA